MTNQPRTFADYNRATCGSCKYWNQFLDENPNAGECMRMIDLEGKVRLVPDLDSPPTAWIETGEKYCDGELWTSRSFSCALYEIGKYEG